MWLLWLVIEPLRLFLLLFSLVYALSLIIVVPVSLFTSCLCSPQSPIRKFLEHNYFRLAYPLAAIVCVVHTLGFGCAVAADLVLLIRDRDIVRTRDVYWKMWLGLTIPFLIYGIILALAVVATLIMMLYVVISVNETETEVANNKNLLTNIIGPESGDELHSLERAARDLNVRAIRENISEKTQCVKLTCVCLGLGYAATIIVGTIIPLIRWWIPFDALFLISVLNDCIAMIFLFCLALVLERDMGMIGQWKGMAKQAWVRIGNNRESFSFIIDI